MQVERMRPSRMPGWWRRVRVASARRSAGMARRSRTSMGAVLWLMPRRTSLPGLVWVGAAFGASIAPPPEFSPNPAVGWVAIQGGFKPPLSGAGPVRDDPSHPTVTNDDFRISGKEPTFPVADLSNPNIKPWAKAIMKRENDKALSGGMPYSARASCMPLGVPAFMMTAVEPIHFVQTPKQVTMIFSGDAQVRRVYLGERMPA